MTNTVSAHHIDFDQWAHLAATNPQEFEILRRKTIYACIERANQARQERLHCLQWRIDRMREHNNSPLGACVAISNLMWETFTRLGELLQDPSTSSQKRSCASEQAKVIDFPGPVTS